MNVWKPMMSMLPKRIWNPSEFRLPQYKNDILMSVLMIVPFLAIFSSNIYDEDMKKEIAKEKAK